MHNRKKSNTTEQMNNKKNGDKKKGDDKRKIIKKGNAGDMSSDDSSVDSKGNIRDLIDYEMEDEFLKVYEGDDSTYVPSDEELSQKKLKKRKSISSSDDESGFSDEGDNSETFSRYFKHRAFIGSDMEDDEDDEDDDEDNDDADGEDEEEDGDEDDDEDDDDADGEDDDDADGEDEEDDDDDEDYEDDKQQIYNLRRGSKNKVFESSPGSFVIKFAPDIEEPLSLEPKRHNMKKESKIVNKFYELLTAPVDDNDIDAQIDQFKALSDEKQQVLVDALEKRPVNTNSSINLMLRILQLNVSQDVKSMILSKYNSLQSMDPSTGEYFKLRNWIEKAASVPFGVCQETPVKIEDGSEKCTEFMMNAKKCLDDAIYGQEEPKLQILQYISSKISNPNRRGMNLLLVGRPGIGKTTLVKNGIAPALQHPFQFISLGGDSDAATYNGHQLVYESSSCGKIVDSLIQAKSMSPILLFDEVDKISDTPKGEEVKNILIHLTDPAAHSDFEDKYLSGIPIDLSKVMFIFSANDITQIDKILLDRLIVIELQGYDIKQKLTIAEKYMLPNALNDINLVGQITFSNDILKYIIEEYANEEAGVRELKRCIEQIVQKINMLRMYNTKDLPFHIANFSLPFILKKEHVDLFLKKKNSSRDKPPFGMYV